MPERILILLPVYNDWQAVSLLIPALDAALPDDVGDVAVLLVDDGSTCEPDPEWISGLLTRIRTVSILHLRRNLGHQRAIAAGLVYVHEHMLCDAVVVMDADGEDRPSDVGVLLRALQAEHGRSVIFAARTKRLESPLFRFFYRSYRVIHRVLTGVPVRVGNFSVIPAAALSRLVVVSDLWNHYAAAVFRARIPHKSVPTVRGARLAGESRMNFVSLLVHGLSAISVFSDVVSARLLAFTSAAILATLFLIVAVVATRLATGLAIPGWATTTAGILLVILTQAVLIALVLVFTITSGRANTSFIPLRDASFFTGRLCNVWPNFVYARVRGIHSSSSAGDVSSQQTVILHE
ncbi:MAG TPA: glycosyltransferase [Bryobacteraceae bacterium]|nr:glycosyltransferase [Bryobacteraceae bacterium]